MRAEHIEGIAEIEKECFSSPWTYEGIEEELGNPNAHFLTALCGKPVGYIGAHEIAGEAYIANIAVLPQYRRMGIGAMLLEKAVRGAQSRGCEFITLEVRRSNLGAIALYEKAGFEIAGERRGFYSDPPEDALIYTKTFNER